MRLACITVLVAACVAVTPHPARAMHWSLGANFGVSILMPEDGENLTLIGWPSGGFGDVFTVPGIRVGFAGDNPQHEFYVDTSLLLASSDGASFRSTQFLANYQ